MALACRKRSFDIKPLLCSNEVAKAIRTNQHELQTLSGIFEPVEAIIAISENPNLLEREKAIDNLKWNWLEEHTFLIILPSNAF